jgi:hypothetical protein
VKYSVLLSGLIASALGVSPATAQTATEFDLNCSGQSNHLTGMSTKPIDEPQTWADTFKVDLAHGKFCEGDCKTVETIYSVTPTQIILREYADDGGDGLNRVNGAYLSERYNGDPQRLRTIKTVVVAQCKAVPFTGLPAMAF